MTRNIQVEIDKLKKHILYLGTAVEENLRKAMKSLNNRDTELAREVKEADHDIDRIEIDVEEECLRILALHQPVASDLRFLVTVLKVNNDLERIGDLAAKIADKVQLLSTNYFPAPLSEESELAEMFRGMYEKTTAMLKMSLDAFVNEDADLAYKILISDDEVDTAKRAIRNQLEDIIQKDPAQHIHLAKLLGVSRCLERIADHCTNIAEDLIYMMQGMIVRHYDVNKE